MTESLYSRIKAAGIPFDSHESDLYVLATPEARQLVDECGAVCSVFVSQVDGRRWLDVPFHYEPFWTRRMKV